MYLCGMTVLTADASSGFKGPLINYVRMILAIFDPPYPHVRVGKIFQTPPLFLRNIPFSFST